MEILFSDEQIIVINKPAGMSVLSDGWDHKSPYLAKMLEEQYGKIFVVHRLDKVTSGVLIFARDTETHRDLNSQFEKHEALKMYHAIVEGNLAWDEKITKFPLRANVGHKHRTIVDNHQGKPSETRFRKLEQYQSSALIEASPMTGRTHQIRAHASALGYPLLGDVLYGAFATDLISRPALHAHSLTITLNNKRVTFTADQPDDFRATLERLKR